MAGSSRSTLLVLVLFGDFIPFSTMLHLTQYCQHPHTHIRTEPDHRRISRKREKFHFLVGRVRVRLCFVRIYLPLRLALYVNLFGPFSCFVSFVFSSSHIFFRVPRCRSATPLAVFWEASIEFRSLCYLNLCLVSVL